ncbi:MAG TPA: SRPBCC family protein [Acidimicrobiales bacterium]|nr:SRPBCC family protein [Acidimicrobiales bacterium]
MNIADNVIISAPADDVWRVFTDVEHWSDWTASVTRAEFVAGAGVAAGARVRMKQPRMPVMTWEVTEYDPGVSWSWVARSPGVVTVARHRLTPQGAGATLVEQEIEHSGPLAGIVGRLTAGRTRRYLALEAAGLKERCEAAARA